MSEPITLQEPATQEPNILEQPTLSSNLQEAMWNDKPMPAAPTQEQPKTGPIVEDPKETTIDPNTYLKDKWGWETEEAADTEIKSLREKASKGFEFKNDDSRKVAEYINDGKLDDLYSYLDTQRKIDKLSTADLTDKKVAEELVKFGMQKDNPNLSADDVDFMFKEKYSLPPKPVKDEMEEDADYEIKLNSWKEQVSNIERRLVIEAKINQPKLAQLKSELVLPAIHKDQSPQLSQEDLDAAKKSQNDFVQYAEPLIDNFTGFNIPVKDKDVDYTVNYTPSAEEKKVIGTKMKEFAESGFDANSLLADRWVNEDGKSLKIDQMIKDLSRLYGDDKVNQKLVTDAVNKRLEVFLKEKKQVSVNEPTGQPNLQQKDKSEEMQEAFWKN